MAIFKRLWGRPRDEGADRPENSAHPDGMVALDAADDVLGELSPLQKEGLNWLALMSSGRATSEDLDALKRWQGQSKAHADAIAWALKLRRLIADQPVMHRRAANMIYRPVSRRVVFGGAAAAAASYIVVSSPLGLWPSWADLSSDFRTAPGERRTVTVAPGVSVELNTRTSVALRSQGDLSGIELVDGEVQVSARLPQSAKFQVLVGRTKVTTATAATFDVRRLDDGGCVTCTEGNLEILNRNSRIALQNGEQVTFTGEMITKPAKADVVVVTAWRQGELIFHDTPFREIVAEINRYRSGKIVILNSDLAERRFNSAFRIEGIGEVVNDLKKLSNASSTSLPGGIILLS